MRSGGPGGYPEERGASMSDGSWMERLRRNVDTVRAEIAAASDRVGRDPGEVRIVGVTKYATLDVARALPGLGIPDLGENRVQQLIEGHLRLSGQSGYSVKAGELLDPFAQGQLQPPMGQGHAKSLRQLFAYFDLPFAKAILFG